MNLLYLSQNPKECVIFYTDYHIRKCISVIQDVLSKKTLCKWQNWVYDSKENLDWFLEFYECAVKEHEFRFNESIDTPIFKNTLKSSMFTSPPFLIPTKQDSIKMYKIYFNNTQRQHFCWSNRPTPEWITNTVSPKFEMLCQIETMLYEFHKYPKKLVSSDIKNKIIELQIKFKFDKNYVFDICEMYSHYEAIVGVIKNQKEILCAIVCIQLKLTDYNHILTNVLTFFELNVKSIVRYETLIIKAFHYILHMPTLYKFQECLKLKKIEYFDTINVKNSIIADVNNVKLKDKQPIFADSTPVLKELNITHRNNRNFNYTKTETINHDYIKYKKEQEHSAGGHSKIVYINDSMLLKYRNKSKEFHHTTLVDNAFLNIISHSNIISIKNVDFYGYAVFDKYNYDLRKYICKFEIDETESITIMKQLLSAVSYLHSLDIVHRDIKPDNIVLDNANDIKLIDFGIAMYAERCKSYNICTAQYRAPEVYKRLKYSKAIDVWACGCVFVELFTKKITFKKTLESIEEYDYDTLNDISPNVKICELIKKMLSIRPETRITARDALTSLESLTVSESI